MKRALVLVLAVGCKDSGQAARKEAPQGVPLPRLGLTIDLPGKTAIVDETYGVGYALRNPVLGAAGSLHVATLQQPLSPDGQKADREVGGFENVALNQGSDGWAMTGTSRDVNATGAKFFVAGYRTIDGRYTECRSAGLMTEDTFKVATAACASLRTTR